MNEYKQLGTNIEMRYLTSLTWSQFPFDAVDIIDDPQGVRRYFGLITQSDNFEMAREQTRTLLQIALVNEIKRLETKVQAGSITGLERIAGILHPELKWRKRKKA